MNKTNTNEEFEVLRRRYWWVDRYREIELHIWNGRRKETLGFPTVRSNRLGFTRPTLIKLKWDKLFFFDRHYLTEKELTMAVKILLYSALTEKTIPVKSKWNSDNEKSWERGKIYIRKQFNKWAKEHNHFVEETRQHQDNMKSKKYLGNCNIDVYIQKL